MEGINEKIEYIKGDISYQELADRVYEKTGLKVHYTTLQKYVKGKREPSKKVLKALAEYAGKPLSWFFEEEENTANLKKPGYTKGYSIPEGYVEVMMEAVNKKIPPKSLKFFIEAVDEAMKTNKK
jgi:transcriptional regulator with XRE-family HTH domain